MTTRILVPGALVATVLLAIPAVTSTRAAVAAYRSPAELTVPAGWLARHLHDHDLVLLHVGDSAEYAREHIPGARFASLRAVSVSSHDHENGLMLEMPSADSLRAQLEALGISNDSKVVVYYGNDWVSPATRIVFTLDYAGLGARTVLLDGGMSAWKATGHAVTREVPDPRRGRLAALRTQPLVVDAAWVRAHLDAPGVRVVDGRSAVYYDGVEAGSGARKGHIAGARSIPFTEIADDSLRLRPLAELRALFDRAGVGPRDTVVAYCHIGQQATAVLFAARALGHPVRLYDGSFQDWSRRADFPVETTPVKAP